MRKVCFFCFVLVFVVIISFALCANAMTLDFETDIVSEEDRVEIIKNIDLQLVREEKAVAPIRCFDVHPDGRYALAFSENGRSDVFVYDAHGVFLYGYTFNPSGAYAIQFRGDFLELYLVRGDVIAVYDPAGNCVEVQNVISTEQNNLKVRELLDRSYKEVAGKKYVLERNWDLGDSYSRFSVVDEYGEKTTLVDVSVENGARQFMLIAYIVIIFAVVICLAYKKYRSDDKSCN